MTEQAKSVWGTHYQANNQFLSRSIREIKQDGIKLPEAKKSVI
jgi:hypothetical protein